MDDIETWEKVLAGILVLLVLLWMRPGLKAALERGRKAENRDWRGVLLPLAFVLLFVLLLISLA